MTNYEHYRKDIEKLARFGIEVALKKDIDRIVSCSEICCDDCLFHFNSCEDDRLQWADEEYKEAEIDWSEVPVDTKIYVCDTVYEDWIPSHFAKYEDDYVYAWDGGCTSFTAKESSVWEYAKLAEEE